MDCDEGMGPQAPGQARRGHRHRLAMVHRYLARDAIVNRAVFLVVLGFIAIFCVCVARNGVLDNVEWIRDRILMVDTSDLDAR